MLSKKSIITVFLTKNGSLAEWQRTGMLHREMAIYKELMSDFSVQLVSYGNFGDLKYEKLYSDLKVLLIPFFKRNLNVKNRLQLFKAERLVKKSSILKTNQINGSDLAIHYSKKMGIPLITRCGYLWSTFTEKIAVDTKSVELAFQLEKNAYKQATIGITSSERDKEFIVKTHGIPPQKMITIPNYVDLSVFKPNFGVREQGTILFIGRFEPQKNIFNLLDAFEKSELAKKIILIGSGSLEAELKEKASPSKKIINFPGLIPNNDLAEYLQKAACYILPSHFEGLPKTLLEAMSCAIPCIGSDVEGIREVISHQENGFLCKTDVDSISNALDEVLFNTQQAKKIGLNAHETIKKHYSLEKIVELEKAIYSKILEK